MQIQGRVKNGVVVLENGRELPEGTLVTVEWDALPQADAPSASKRVRLPLVPSVNPGCNRLTAERIAEIVEQEDVSS